MTAHEFKTTVLPQYRSMYALAMSMLHSTDDAADAVQETMTHLWERRDTITAVTDIKAYCMRALSNRVCSSLRSTQHNEPIDEQITDHTDSPSTVEHQINLADTRIALAKALSQMPRRNRIVFSLATFRGESTRKISIDTGLTEVNVRAILSRTRRSLRSLLPYD